MAQCGHELDTLAALMAQEFSKKISALDEQVPFSCRADVSAGWRSHLYDVHAHTTREVTGVS